MTTAYDPYKPRKEEEAKKGLVKKTGGEEAEDSESSSSEDEDDYGLWKVGEQKVVPHIGDELNHAKCIKDLSFYKLNWDDKDLEGFHRPNIQE